jgi:hypothetical protein
MSRFNVILSSSVKGELGRQVAASRIDAFSVAMRMLYDRAEAELRNDPAPLHAEVVSIRIEQDDA